MKKNLLHAGILIVFLFFLTTGMSFAEGTKTISPTSSYCTALAIVPDQNKGAFIGVTNADNKIHFYIDDFSKEKLYYGFNWGDWGATARYSGSNAMWENRVIMRIYNPDGSFNSDVPLGSSISAGYIQDYDHAVAGPNISGGNTNGYTPGVFTPTSKGEYTVLFKKQYYDYWGGWQDSQTDWFNSPYFDFTVAKNNSAINGRVYCQQWSFVAITPGTFANNNLASAEPVVYPYTNDGVVYQVDFSPGFEPIAFILAMNSYGVTNSGNWATDRKSKSEKDVGGMTGCFKVFLNQPDGAIFPSGVAPSAPVFASPEITGKWPGPYNVRFRLQEVGDCKFLIDLNNNGKYDQNTTDRIIDVPSCVVGLNSFVWDGKDGKGNSVPRGTSVTIIVTTQKGRTNMPLIDVEINKNGFNVSTISPVSNPHNQIYWDDSALTPITGQNSGYNNTTSGGIDNSIYGTASPGHAWNGDGNPGQMLPAPAVGSNDTDQNTENDFGNVRVINTWFWGLSTSASHARIIDDVSISGTVWNDINNSAAGTFTNIKTGTEAGTNGGGLYAILVDPETNTVLSSTAVNSDGTYTLTGCPIYGNSMPVILSTSPGTIDAAPPTAGISSDWINTSPLVRTVTTVTSNITLVDFGVQQKPTAVGSTTTITPIPTGTNTTSVASYFGGTDPANGIISSLKITAFPTNATSITINGTNYTSATFPAGGIIVPTNATGQPTQAILIDPIGDVAITVTIPFVVIDNGGAQSNNTANVVLNYVPQADVQITKTPNTTTPNVGGNVTFTLVAKNNGPNGATNVNVSDNIPSGYAFVSATPTLGSWSAPTWTVGSLASGASATLTVVATVNVTGIYANTANVTGTETDTNVANNTVTSTPTPKPIVTFTYGNSAYCKDAANPTPSLSANGVAGTFSAVPAGLAFVSVTTGQINLSASNAGTYTVTNTVAASGAYAANSASTIVTINSLPTITGNTSVCIGFTSALSGSGTANSTNPWVSSNTAVATISNTGVVTGKAGGTATITYTDINGCNNKITITVNTLPTYTSTQTPVSCYGGNDGKIVVTASGGSGSYQYSINGGGTYTSTNTFSGLIANDYTIKVRDTNGCISNP